MCCENVPTYQRFQDKTSFIVKTKDLLVIFENRLTLLFSVFQIEHVFKHL